MNQLTNKEDLISDAIEKYADMVYRICFLQLKNKLDVEDAFQEIFLKYVQNKHIFKNQQHEKSWLCKVAYNQCKDIKKSFWKSKVISIDNLILPSNDPNHSELASILSTLPPHEKQVIYLHYYEKMPIPEIAALLHKNTNTVYTWLRRAKEKLKHILKEAL